MNRLILLVATGLLETTTPSYAQEKLPAPPSATTTSSSMMAKVDATGFVKEAAASNEFEIMSSQVALKRSKSSEVRDFAETMIKHHRRAQNELQAAAAADSNKVAIQFSLEQKQTLEALEHADESQFDSAYFSSQLKAHEQAIALLGGYAEAGEAGALKVWANAYYPTVRMHQVRAHSLTNP